MMAYGRTRPSSTSPLSVASTAPVAKPEKQTVLDDAGHAVENVRQPFRRIDPLKMRVEDEVPAVGQERLAAAALAQAQIVARPDPLKRLRQCPAGRLETEGDDLDRQRKAPET